MITRKTKAWKQFQVCEFYADGNRCLLGEKCLYLHIQAGDMHTVVTAAKRNGPFFPVTQWTRKKKEPCAFYLTSRSCRYGSYCKYLHDPNATVYAVPEEKFREHVPLTAQMSCKQDFPDLASKPTDRKALTPKNPEASQSPPQNLKHTQNIAESKLDAQGQSHEPPPAVGDVERQEREKEKETVFERREDEGEVVKEREVRSESSSSSQPGGGKEAGEPKRQPTSLERRLMEIESREKKFYGAADKYDPGHASRRFSKTDLPPLRSQSFDHQQPQPQPHPQPQAMPQQVQPQVQAQTVTPGMGSLAYDREIYELKKQLEILELKRKIEALERAPAHVPPAVTPQAPVAGPVPTPTPAQPPAGVPAPFVGGSAHYMDGGNMHVHQQQQQALDHRGAVHVGSGPAPGMMANNRTGSLTPNETFYDNQNFGFMSQLQNTGGHGQVQQHSAFLPSAYEKPTTWQCSRCSTVNDVGSTNCTRCFSYNSPNTVETPMMQEEPSGKSMVAPPPGFSGFQNDAMGSILSASSEPAPAELHAETAQPTAQGTTAAGEHVVESNTEQQDAAYEPEQSDEVQEYQQTADVDTGEQSPEDEVDTVEQRHLESEYIYDVVDSVPASTPQEITSESFNESSYQEEPAATVEDPPEKKTMKWNELFNKPQTTAPVQQVAQPPVVEEPPPVQPVPTYAEQITRGEQEASLGSDITSEQWVCEQCDTRNPLQAVACRTCHYSKYSASAVRHEETESDPRRRASVASETSNDMDAESKKRNMWKCDKCHKFNEKSLVECEACHVRRSKNKSDASKKSKRSKKKTENVASTDEFMILDYIPEPSAADEEEEPAVSKKKKKTKKKKSKGLDVIPEANEKKGQAADAAGKKKKEEDKGKENEQEAEKKGKDKGKGNVLTENVLQCKKEGDAFLKRKKYKKALKCFEEGTKLDAKNPLFFNSCGSIHMLLKQPELAAPFFEQAKELDPKHFKCYLGLGKVHFALGEPRKAKDAFTTAVKLRSKAKTECESEMKEIEWQIKQLQTVSDLVRKGRWVLAKEKIEESLKRMPKCEEMHDYKRECEENQLKKEVEVKRELKVELKELLSYADNKVLLDKAHAKALEVLRAQPTDPEAYHLYCQVAFRQGDIDLALPNAKMCTKLAPDNEAYKEQLEKVEHLRRTVLLAQTKFKESQCQVSFDACRIALHNLGIGNYQSKLRMELRQLAGENLIRLVRLDEARKYFEAMITEDAKFLTSGLAHLNLALCIYSETLRDDCNLVETLEKVLQICKQGLTMATGAREEQRFLHLQDKVADWLSAIRQNDRSRICPCCGRYLCDESEDSDYDDEEEDDESYSDGETYVTDVDFYKALGLKQDATQAEIRQAFETVTLADLEGEVKEGTNVRLFQQFKDGVTAYKVLSDPEMRMKYDNGVLTKQDLTHCNGFNHFVNLLEDIGLLDGFKGMLSSLD